MSDLQIGLAMLGVLVVASVLAFNWWQEKQFRRRGEEAFSGRHDDVLLDHAGTPPQAAASRAQHAYDDEPRIEPRMPPQMAGTASAQVPAARKAGAADLPRSEIDYIVEIRAGEYISADKLARLEQILPALARRIIFGGLNHQSQDWEALLPGAQRYTSVRAALQLVDRSGPVSAEQLRAFGEATRTIAGELAAIAELPEYAPALEHAGALDKFCQEVDVLVGINVIANTGQAFPGTKIRALAEAAGLHLQATGSFYCHDDQGSTLFSLDNQDSEPFLIDRIRNMTTPGVTFLLDVPRVPNGLRVFDKMVAMSRSFADSLDGTLADDNRVMLNDSGLDKIREQLRRIHGAMEQRGIQAGTPLALRLFS